MIGGITNLLRALRPTPTPEMVHTMEIIGERPMFLLLSDDDDDSSGYEEFDSLTEAMTALELLQEDEDIYYLRLRSISGYRLHWRHPDTITGDAVTNNTELPYLVLIDYKDGSTGYEEHDSLRSLAFAAADLREDNDLCHFRVRYPNGNEFCWENPSQLVEDED